MVGRTRAETAPALAMPKAYRLRPPSRASRLRRCWRTLDGITAEVSHAKRIALDPTRRPGPRRPLVAIRAAPIPAHPIGI